MGLPIMTDEVRRSLGGIHITLSVSLVVANFSKIAVSTLGEVNSMPSTTNKR